MDLLGFARGPALKIALVIFCLGVTWRIVGFALLRLRRDWNTPRESMLRSWVGGIVTVGSRSWPHKEFIGRTGAGEALGYSYHIGLFIVILLFTPHILFLGSLFGVTWPGLPSSLITVISVLTLTLFLAVLFRRVTNSVLRMISNFDDYFSWFITALVMVTGSGRHRSHRRPVPDFARRAHPERRCAAHLVPLRQADARLLYLSLARTQRRTTCTQRSHLMSEPRRASRQSRPGGQDTAGSRGWRHEGLRPGNRCAQRLQARILHPLRHLRGRLSFLHCHRGPAVHADLESGTLQTSVQA